MECIPISEPVMNREEAVKLFREDKNSYGQTRAPMTKLKLIYDEFELELRTRAAYIKELEDKIYDMQNIL